MNNDDTKKNRDLTVVELFAGIGGFRIGFDRAGGFKTVYSNDFDSWCKKTFDNYFGEGSLDLRDIQKVDASEIPDKRFVKGNPFRKNGRPHQSNGCS